MSMQLMPDPAEPGGGYAFIALPLNSLPEEQVTVTIFDAYSGRWLARSDESDRQIAVGNGNWQGQAHPFGPYLVRRHQGHDWVRIGPEIVNKIEEYAPLRLSVGGVSAEINWPDTIIPRAGAAVLGGIQSTARTTEATVTNLVARQKPAAPAPQIEPIPAPEEEPTIVLPREAPPEVMLEPDPMPDPTVDQPPSPEPRRKRRFGLIGEVIALVLAGFLVWGLYLLMLPETPANLPSTIAAVEPSETSPCSFTQLSATQGGFGAVRGALAGCVGQVTPETTLRLIEDAARANDAEALHLFGVLYDSERIDVVIEEQIGLTFAGALARATEYFARAAAAGNPASDAALQSVCVRLQDMSETLARGAYDDFCR